MLSPTEGAQTHYAVIELDAAQSAASVDLGRFTVNVSAPIVMWA
jgi:hypothetical protein